MTSLDRRSFVARAAALAAAAAAPRLTLAQETFPSKPIRAIVPLPAGGAADVTVRLVTAAMQEQLKKPFVVDNRPGGIFTIGMQAMSTAPADGYTLMHINVGMLAAQAALRRFDLLKSLAPISLIGTMPTLLVTSGKGGFTTMKELIVYGRANPGKINYGSVGLGSMEHLWTHNFFKEVGVAAVHVPFKGMPDAATALVRNEVQFVSMVYSVSQPFVLQGLMQALGCSTNERIAGAHEVPSLKDLGINVPPLAFWGGFAAPAGTPTAILERLRKETVIAVSNPDVVSKLRATGTAPQASESPAAFAKLIEADLGWMLAAVKSANLQLS